MFILFKIIGSALMILALGGGFYINSQRATLIEKAVATAQETASQTLGVPVKIGGFEFNDSDLFNLDKDRDATIRNVEVFDKKNELIARVEEATVNFKLITLYNIWKGDDPVAALDTIKLNGVTLNLKKRDDNSWNVKDIKLDSEGDSTFDAEVLLERGTLNAEFDGKKITLEDIIVEADCADMNAVATKLSAKTLGAHVQASGTLGAAQQIVNAEVDEIFFAKVLPYLPPDTIPEGVQVLSGKAEHFTLNVLHRDKTLEYLGSAQVKGAAVKVEETNVENINGNIAFNNHEIILNATATANGQQAAAGGTIRLDTDETFFDIHAESDSFTPSAIIKDIGLEGAASIQAHLAGTAKAPVVDADIYSDWLRYENLSAANVSTKLHYAGDLLHLSNLRANVFGGSVAGTVEIKTSDLSYNANVKANALDAATLCQLANAAVNVSGKISAELGINGGNAPMKVYGSAQTTGLDFDGLHLNAANASFYFTDADLTIDYLSAKLPDSGTLGLEGTIKGDGKLDLSFYGAHVDLSLAKRFDNQIDLSGLADFKGTVQGNADNPDVTLLLSAIDNSAREGERFKGTVFKQPYDSIKLMASGSLDGVRIDDFTLEKDGKLKWKVLEGFVSLRGDKRVNVQLDTTAVRAEEIAALVAPDQDITGNVTNTVKITGTLDAPQVVGNIKFNRGSYRGVLLNGMTGDYSLEGDILTLQDFEITSPMVDMVLNGTINKTSQVMNFIVEGKDINLQRFKAKLPEKYNAEGHVKFEGRISGTPATLIADGELSADEIYLNGIALTNTYGHFSYNNSNGNLHLKDFHFSDGDAHCHAQIDCNLNTDALSGELNLTNGNIANLFTIFNVNNTLLDGKLNSKVLVNGTLSKPRGSLKGEIPQGTFAGYDVHDFKVDMSLIDNDLTVKQLEGKQGDKGTLNLRGVANLVGKLDLTLVAKDIELGMFSKAAGFDWEVVGTSNIVGKLSKTVDDPFGEVIMTATGGIKGSTFDLLHGHFLLKDWRVNVEELTVERKLAGKTYGTTVKGFVPLRALTAHSKDKLPDNEQLDLTLSLDGADLSLLPVLSDKFISFGVGELKGEVKITGTAAHPQFNGQIALNDGSIKVKGMKSLIEHINISMLLKGERFDIENFTGNIGGGTFATTGGFNFAGFEFKDYNFDLVADNLDINSDIYKGLFNANFNFSEGRIFRQTLPKLSGQINLDKCRLSLPTIPESDDPLPDIILDVSLNLGEKVHFYDPKLYGIKIDTYFTGNAHFGGTTQRPNTSGSIYVKRGGTLTYVESVFNIREGEAHFNQLGSFFPTVRFFAETKIDRTKVFLGVNGTIDNMKFILTSSPEMTQEEIIQLLTLREAYSKGSGANLSTADALAIGLRMTVLADIEDALKRTLGIDQLTVNRGSGSMFESHFTNEQSGGERDRDYNVKFGKYINDKLMLRYTRGFGNHHVNRYGIQYDFNDNFGLTIEREGKDYIFSFEARYKF